MHKSELIPCTMGWSEQSTYWHSPRQIVQLHRYRWSHNDRKCYASQCHWGHRWRGLLPETAPKWTTITSQYKYTTVLLTHTNYG